MKRQLQTCSLFCTSLVMLLVLFLANCSDSRSLSKADIDSDKSQLKMLRASGEAISPLFEITRKHYVSTAAFSVLKIQLQTWPKQRDSIVSINGEPVNDITEHSLAIGSNEFTVSVSADDGNEDRYHLTITRLPEIKYR